jgi:hypothetical protein
MNTRCLRAVILGGMVVTLALFPGGCENPAGGDGGPSAAAEEFRDSHREILDLLPARAALSDEAAIDAALEAYEALEDGVKAELAEEKEKLDSLKARINTRRTSTSALYTYLEGLPKNTVYTPYYAAYTGNEAPADIYKVLAAAGKYVSLDLSKSGVTGFEYEVDAGRAWIIDLILPDTLEEIRDSFSTAPAFSGFDNLKTIRSSGLLRVGAYAFTNCESLEEVTLDEAAEIGTYAFYNTGIKTVSLPKTTTVGANGFRNCTRLTTVHLPEAAVLETSSFESCTSLEEIILPKVINIFPSVFADCTRLTTVHLPELVTLGGNTFRLCTSLTTIDLPAATSLGTVAFSYCTSLTTVHLPKAETLERNLFRQCTSLETITLGETPPAIGSLIFMEAAAIVRTITIEVPGTKLADYQAAAIMSGKTWADVTHPNTNIDAGYFWSSSNNLTVALTAIDG